MKYQYFMVLILVTTLNSGILPDYKLTPGETDQFTTLSWVCNDYIDSSPPKLSDIKKVYTNYGIKLNDPNYKLDYLIPISLGGTNTIKNMWPQKQKQWLLKNKIENDIKLDVCNGKLSLKEAQIFLTTNWSNWKKEDSLIKGTLTKDSLVKKSTKD